MPQDKVNILIADDDPRNLLALDAVLEPLGQNVVRASSGQEVLTLAERYEFAVLVLDVRMPSMSGFETARLIRQRTGQHTPIIFLSAADQTAAEIVKGYEVGATDFLTKPIVPELLRYKVAAFVELFQKTSELERLRAEQSQRALQASEERLRLVVESVRDFAIFTLDRQGVIASWNTGAAQLFGWQEEEILGKPFRTLFTPEDQQANMAEAEIEKATRAGRAEDERWHQRRDGSRFFASGVTTHLVDEQGRLEGFTKIARDVTERKLAEEERSRLLAEAREARRVSEQFAAQLQGLAKAAVSINSALSAEAALQIATDEARRIVGAHQSITSLTLDRDWAQSVNAVSLSDKYAEYRDFSEPPTGEGIYQLVCRTNRPLRLSQAELEGHPAWKGFSRHAGRHPPMRGWLAAPLIARDGSNMGLVQLSDKVEGEFGDSDEAIIVQLAQMASVAIENGRFVKAIQEARSDAEAANRMKDEFLATLSHELRTPLNAITGWTQLLRLPKVSSEDLAQGLEVIDRNAQVQAQLIEDLLDISRIISGKLRLDIHAVNPAQPIQAAVASVAHAAEARQIEIQTLLDSAANLVAADPARLQQIVWNLLSNAVKFTPPGGRVTVRLAREQGRARISVADTGQGIKAEFLPYVFDRFRQADASTTRRHGGLGLGLSIVRQLVDLHGGAIEVQSAGENQGTTFTVSLPLAAERPTFSAPTRAPQSAAAAADCLAGMLGGVMVLVVDDEPDAREIIQRILTKCQAEVALASSAREALELLEQRRPDVLISDIGMPGVDGYDLIRAIRGRGYSGKELPAIALTAFARSEDRRRALMAGFQIHVVKPVDANELTAVVASLTGRIGG
jgi:PAS domain S-box-containing protein